jgi:hypothetical protein
MNDAINLNNRNTPTIHQLRRAGWKVRVIHGFTNHNLPFGPKSSKNQEPLSERFTRIELTSPENKDSTGIAYCSKRDQWNRKLGNRIALGRALKDYSAVN